MLAMINKTRGAVNPIPSPLKSVIKMAVTDEKYSGSKPGVLKISVRNNAVNSERLVLLKKKHPYDNLK